MRRLKQLSQQDNQRVLDYLLAEEKEERNERRGLEQRAAGLLAALLVSLPVVATVAKDADTDVPADVAGLALLGIALLLTIWQAWKVTRALGAAPKSGSGVKEARRQVRQRLSRGELMRAAIRQGDVVDALREDNVRLVGKVRKATRGLPVLLLMVLIGLALVIAGRSNDSTSDDAVPVPRTTTGTSGPSGS